MKQILLFLIGCVLIGPHSAQATPADTSVGGSGCKLSIELRDGSHIVGTAVKDTVRLHSAAMGDLTLSWSGLRSLEFTADTGAAKLTATNGDSFAVQFTADTLPLQTGFGETKLPVKQIRNIKVTSPPKLNPALAPVVGQSGWRLTVELRDGSRLTGKGLEDVLNFHSATMGDLKLTWGGIRSLEYASATSDVARLTATNKDVYEVQFASTTVRLETSWGKTKVPVKTIRSIKVSPAGGTAAAGHLVGWWKLDDGNGTVAKDSVSQNPHDGTIVNGPLWTAEPGEKTLQFNGVQYVSLGNILQGSYPEMSIACWVKHGRSQWQTVVGRGTANDPDGISLTMDYNQTSVSFGHYPDMVKSRANAQDNQWHHVVGTLSHDDSGYVYSIYVDGKLDNTSTGNPRGLTATANGWSIGAHYDGAWAYLGLIQDVRIYDCALSDSEVQAIFAEQNHIGLPATPNSPPSF